MANPTWFDVKFYMASKLAQIQKADPTGEWTAEKLQAAFDAAGFTGDEGAYNHYNAYSLAEGTSPSQYLDSAVYLAGKLQQMQKTDATYTMEQLVKAFQDAGLTVGEHYTQFGAAEGVNPSNEFDDAKYMASKLEELQKTDPDHGWTAEEVQKAFTDAGLTPLDHYLLYGKDEGVTPTPVAEPIKPVNPGTSFTLTTAVETVTGTAADDTFVGVASALSSEGTLNAGDQIDGGAGNDTLTVDMKGSFNGFTGDGKMVNVENVELTNNTTIPTTFSAAGVTGVETYTLKSSDVAINLSNVAAAGITVNVEGLKSGNTTIGFTADAVKGTADAMTLGLNGVGTEKVGTTAAQYVTPTAEGIENLTVKATGDNYVNLSAAATKGITTSGAGTLNVEAINSSVKTFDASAAAGAVKANLSGATLSAVKGGAGDDTFTVTKLASTTTLAGGEGNDTLILSGVTGSVKPTMSGFENVTVDGTADGALTIVGQNISDFTGMTVKGKSTVSLASVNAAEFSVTSQGATTDSTQAITLNDATSLTYNTVASAAADKTTETIDATLKAYKATSATINVGEKTTLIGTINADAAQSVVLNVASAKDGDTELTAYNGILNAAKASSLVVKADGALGATFKVASATSVDVTAAQGGTAAITAAAATNVNITADKDLAITGSTLSAAQTVVLTQNDGALTGVDLGKVNSLTVSGAGTDSAVKVGTLGNADQTYGVTVNASGLAKGLTFGDIKTKADVALDFTAMSGKVNAAGITGANVTVNATGDSNAITLGAINASKAVTINALDRYEGILTVGAISNDNTAATAVNVKIGGEAAVDFSTIKAKTVTIDASDYSQDITSGSDAATFGAITATTSANIIGAGAHANRFDVRSNNVTYTGGVESDTLMVLANATTDTAGKQASLSLNAKLGAGTDSLLIMGQDADGTKVTGTMDGGTDTNTLSIGGGNPVDISGATISNFTSLDLAVKTGTGGTACDDTVIMKVAQYKAFDNITADKAASDNAVGDTIQFSDAAGTATAALELKGVANLTYQLGNFANFVKADAAATITIIGGDKADSIDVSAIGDEATTTIRGGAGADKITLGDGADTLKYAALTDSTASAYDTVNSFTVGTDKIDVSAIAAATVAQGDSIANGKLTLGEGVTTLTAAVTAANTAAIGANKAVFFTLADGTEGAMNTYFFMEGGEDNADLVVKLAGVTDAATMTATNGVFTLAAASE